MTAVADRLEGRRVLVTGASGFLGRHVCARLREERADLHLVSRMPRTSTDPSVRWWQADLEDLEATRKLMVWVKPETVLHFGGLVNGAPDMALVVPTFHSLVTSTVNLLMAAAETGCRRVVLVGSLEEPDAVLADVSPRSPYGAAKLAMRIYGRLFDRLFGLPVVVIRLHMTYGPGQAHWKLIPSTILSLLKGEAPRVSSGLRELDWVYVDDVVEGLLLAASARDLGGQAFDLGSGRLTPLREIVHRLVDQVAPGTEPVFGALSDRPRATERPADLERTRAVIGWAPTTSLDEGLKLTVEWYRRDLEGRRRDGGASGDPASHLIEVSRLAREGVTYEGRTVLRRPRHAAP